VKEFGRKTSSSTEVLSQRSPQGGEGNHASPAVLASSEFKARALPLKQSARAERSLQPTSR
jgi:hypothetical protein